MFSKGQVRPALSAVVALLIIVSACVSSDDEPWSLLEPAPSTTLGWQETLLPGGDTIKSGATIDAGTEYRYQIYTHCGIEWLGEFNGTLWRADVPPGVLDYVPAAWARAVGDRQSVLVSLILATAPERTITATVNEVDVIYRPTTKATPGCD